MKNFKISFPATDANFKETIKNFFGENVNFVEERSVTAMDIVFVAIIPSVGVTIQLIDFILTYLVKTPTQIPQEDKEAQIEEAKKAQRKIEIENSRVSLYNYPAEEAVTIINVVLGGDKNA